MTRDDKLVAAYMRRLRRAARLLPHDRRRELVGQVAEHIAEARQSARQPGSAHADVTAVLDQLGSPHDIVAAADDGVRAGAGAAEIAAVVLLLIGSALAVVGWIAGVILLWSSPRWRRADKLLGTLVWPGGLISVIFLIEAGFFLPWTVTPFGETTPFMVWHCFGYQPAHGGTPAGHFCTGHPTLLYWAGMAIVVTLLLCAQIVVAFRLLRRVRAQPGADGIAAAEPAAG